MLRKDIFGGSSQVDHADRLNKIVAGTEINGDLTSDSNIHLASASAHSAAALASNAPFAILGTFSLWNFYREAS
jgi:hypothetical protein